MTKRMADIAKLAGVAESTVSRAFSHPEKLRKETLERIMSIVRMYDYHPNTMARAFARQQFGLVSFLLYNKSRPFWGSNFYGPALDGFMERAKVRGYHVVLGATAIQNDFFEESFINDSIDGAILASRDPDPILRVFQKRGIPIVLFQNETALENVGMVTNSDYNGIMKVMDHLIEERGYEDIAFFSNRLSHVSNMPRYFAYIDALRQHGLKPYTNDELPEYPLYNKYEPNPVILARYGRSEIPRFGSPFIVSAGHTKFVENAMLKLLPLKKMPRAIVCADDNIAAGVCSALKQKGYRIPQDVAVTGYDDLEMASLLTPPLTTVRLDSYQMGAESMELLNQYISDPKTPSKRICLEDELVIRESS